MPLPLPSAVRNAGAAVVGTAAVQPEFAVVVAAVGLVVGLVAAVVSVADLASC